MKLRLLPLVLALSSLMLGGCAATSQLLGGLLPTQMLRADLASADKPAADKTGPATAAAPGPTAKPANASSGTATAAVAPTLPPTPAPAATPAPVAAPEPRFDVIVSGAKVRDVFLAMVSDTPYSMLMHPDVKGELSVTLRGVTLREALESIRDVYGFDFRIDGRRITVFPPTMQTRLFTVNYLHTKRQGRSEVRVSGSGAPSSNQGGSGQNGGQNNGQGGSTGQNGSSMPDSSQISTTSSSDIWTETTDALRAMVGNAGGRAVIASPQAGTIAVRAMPDELRQVESFLRASRMAIERQVMLEAKIIEVELREGFNSGIDWSYLGSKGAIGQSSGSATNPLLSNTGGLPTLGAAASGLIDSIGLPAGGGGTLGLSLATKGFQAVMGFLQTQGDLQVLSSPRVATLNNQKAVLKVGTDEYFVTNVAGGSVPSGNANDGTTTLPTLTLTPFFSGIALDVTPQIDENDMITLHLRPSVTSVTEKTKQIDLGTVGNYRLPLASSSVNETDTVVRVQDGNIVAIGGLMQSESTRRQSGLPGSGSNAVTRTLFGNQADSGRKKELVVLIRPTILRTAEDWARTTQQALAGLESSVPSRTIRLDGTPTKP